MTTTNLHVVLAEQRLSEAGLTLRSLCAEAGWSLELVFVENRTNLAQALQAHCPDVVFLQLALLQPDAPARLRVLHQSHPSIPFILFADPADRPFFSPKIMIPFAKWCASRWLAWASGFFPRRMARRPCSFVSSKLPLWRSWTL